MTKAKKIQTGYIDETCGYFLTLLEKAKSEGRAEATTKMINLFRSFDYEIRLTPNEILKLISENA